MLPPSEQRHEEKVLHTQPIRWEMKHRSTNYVTQERERVEPSITGIPLEVKGRPKSAALAASAASVQPNSDTIVMACAIILCFKLVLKQGFNNVEEDDELTVGVVITPN